MAIRDPSKNTSLADKDANVFIGLDYPLNRDHGVNGYFASTSTTLAAAKNNVRLLLSTEKGERLMQPHLGTSLRKYLFEPYTEELRIRIENDIVDTFSTWLPWITITDIQISMADNPSFGNNKMKIKLVFSVKTDPNSLDSVVVDLGE